MTKTLTRLRWLAGVVWTLSWFELYLEIIRFRHVALPSWLSLGASAPAIGPESHAGWWSRADLACAVLAPAICIGLTALLRKRPRAAPALLPTATIAAIGALVGALGLINQLIWRPPLVVDLTLRQGNSGFVAFGLGCVLVAAVGAIRVAGVRRTKEESH